MKTKRAILTGMAIWAVAILFYSVSFYVPIMKDAEAQANVVLFVIVMPIVWLGSSFYYKKDNKTHGYIVGQTMLLTAVALDATITVPFFIIPNGGSYYGFFTSLGFWIVAFEFLTIAILYWYSQVDPTTNKLKK
ncbi:hypothetical protein DKG77_11615 [Flagellimonas aquimarina]|jgi:hypothetical protein|uniref:DUF5367 domain-containing protein n=1 Tax=Flagellimonas aquimarina TaxID=2201895 RepID=A0A316L0P2_9FLAO|nr:DUF5367 domain-containing protein [Allomuricauda koreensis]PWL38878.1 hypothetical protein DKG77_11615 [Allomuricauda koreensis]